MPEYWIITQETVYRVPGWAETEEEALEALEQWGRCVDQTHTVEPHWNWVPQSARSHSTGEEQQ